MTTVLSPASAVRSPESTALASALADRLDRGARELAALAGTLSEAEWKIPVSNGGRTIGVVVHHVASVYPIEIQLAQMLAVGQPITDVTWGAIHAMNAEHAAAHAETTKAEAIELLARNSSAASAAIRALGDEQLRNAATVSLYGNAPLTCQFLLEDHAVRHSYHHLAQIKAALGA